MEKEKIISIVKNASKGKFISITKQKDLGQGVRKETVMVMRIGVNYQNMKINEGRTVGSLPYGHWVDGLENLVIEHKGKYYLRVSNGCIRKPKSTYYVGNKEIDESTAKSIVGEKKLVSKASAVYNISFDNIINIKKQNINVKKQQVKAKLIRK